jgi:N-acetylmuramic acid 6-phosphate etherase
MKGITKFIPYKDIHKDFANALKKAKDLGCVTVSLSSNLPCRIADVADMAIFADTGAEVITGSTRMKAGSAHKMVLNMISTTLMIKQGQVYENLMINLKPTNIKLKKRVISIVCDILSCDEETAVALLEQHNWSIRETVDACAER